MRSFVSTPQTIGRGFAEGVGGPFFVENHFDEATWRPKIGARCFAKAVSRLKIDAKVLSIRGALFTVLLGRGVDKMSNWLDEPAVGLDPRFAAFASAVRRGSKTSW
jgi:hypothetical protein